MELLSLNFFIYTMGGIWRPVEWTSGYAKVLYSVFSFCTIVPIYFLMLTQFMDLVLVVDNVDDFITNSLMFMTIVAVCCKATTALLRRDVIIDLMQTLSREPCKPQDADEAAIQMKFDEFIRSCSIMYSLLATSSLTGVTVRSVLNAMQGVLPYRAWLPYDSTLSLAFWITSIQQMTSLIFATIINVGTETLVFGLFLQTCAQLEILERRLHKLVIDRTAGKAAGGQRKWSSVAPPLREKGMISGYIHHHLRIYELVMYARTVNGVFNQILFVQFFGSILTLCTSVYYLSSHIMEITAATMVIYTAGMFVQIYVYCWSGNEVILKSTNVGDAIYHTDWPLLTISEKKDLLMIMRRSAIPIKFTSSFLITLSLQSYSNILKTSYSAFNVLQQS
ncbi:odorant receptor 46a isoform X1 [Harpegnathos saltator]|uniref:odorant receptor 46a isoform X1 n=1 Tax=Harpegnathos saltator TaxID=610380 RepID=UPI000DBEEE02|nr:odorant receptor 46a isoform X1 [Harpegnathos saltator]